LSLSSIAERLHTSQLKPHLQRCWCIPLQQARRLARKLETHYTPKQGGWLNIAETELGALNGQCPNRRIPEIKTMCGEAAAWQGDCNASHTGANWRCTRKDARIGPRHDPLHPVMGCCGIAPFILVVRRRIAGPLPRWG